MLTLLAAASVGLALGGGWVAHWRTADQMAVSLLRSQEVCDECDWASDEWWELSR